MINVIFRAFDSISRRYANLIWRLRLKVVGDNTVFDIGVEIYNPQNIKIGKNCVINNGVILQSCENGKVIIGDNVTISYNAVLLTCGIELDNYPENKTHFSKDIVIEDEVWIGANVTILPGVKISSGVVVAAGSVVTKSIEKNIIVAGVPAQKIKSLNE
jgi:acetyltransferase-like isoleucine patch superfamily enzyme